MHKESYKIISALYKILGEYSREDIVEASRQNGLPSGLSAALRALASEADRDLPNMLSQQKKSRRAREKLREEKSTRREEGPANGHGRAPSLSPKLPPEIYKRNLQSFLNSKARFRNKQDLVEFALKLGFLEPISTKDSRDRVEKKIIRNALDDPKFRDDLYQVIPNDWSKQTSGWLELILGSKK